MRNRSRYQLNSFTFRHVVHALGLPTTNEVHWAIGQQIKQIAARKGVEPERLLTQKTNPHPTVDAPHCIAHYPMRLFPTVCDELRRAWQHHGHQQDLF